MNKVKTMSAEFNIWEGIYPDFESAQKEGKGFSAKRYIVQAKKAATESLLAISEKMKIPLFHKQRFTLLPITVSFLLGLKEEINIIDFGGGARSWLYELLREHTSSQ